MPAPPQVPHGKRAWVLSLPWNSRVGAGQVTYYKPWKVHIYIGEDLPDELAPYASLPYSYQRWLEDTLNGTPGPGATAPAKTPRPDQIADAQVIAAAAYAGYRGVYVANAVGTGKTITTLLAAKVVARMRGVDTVLITVDRPTAITIPAWRDAIAAMGDDGLRWIIISADGLGKLVGADGRPVMRFGVVLLDEAHLFRHDSQRTGHMRRVTGMCQAHDRAPFVIAITATPGHSPAEWGYLSSLFAQVHGDRPQVWADFGQALADRGVPLVKSFGRWGWSPEAKASLAAQTAAIESVRDVLLRHDPPLMITRDAPWGEPPLEVALVDLDADQRRDYELEWREFRRQMHLARSGNDESRGLAAVMRLRQKAALIRVDHTVQAVIADVQRGYQVLVATELVSTAADPVAERLADAGYSVARIYGSGGDAEAERLRFQRGQAQVVVFNTTSSINLHAGEVLPDGSRATSVPRKGFFHQPRYSGIAARQTMGRAHRDFQVCSWSLLAGAGTIEQSAAQVMFSRLATTTTSTDGDISTIAAVAEVFNAQWFSPTTLRRLAFS